MKIKTLLVILVIGAIIYYIFDSKKYQSTSKPCTDCEGNLTKDETIAAIVEKNKSFLAEWAEKFGKRFDQLDLSWLQEKTPEQLNELLAMNVADFKIEVLRLVSFN
jgi:hypothetical protein